MGKVEPPGRDRSGELQEVKVNRSLEKGVSISSRLLRHNSSVNVKVFEFAPCASLRSCSLTVAGSY